MIKFRFSLQSVLDKEEMDKEKIERDFSTIHANIDLVIEKNESNRYGNLKVN